MARKILVAAVVLVVLWFGYTSYMSWRKSHSMAGGDITSADDAARSAAASVDDAPKVSSTPPSSATQPITIQPSVPLTDSQQPNSTNGARFAGSGKYQVYRQGNLTYRIDTETGQECVLLATDEEWRKPRVYERGCGSNAR